MKMLTTTVSLHMGMCFYIAAFAADLRMHLACIDEHAMDKSDSLTNWAIYVKQCRLHKDMLE